MTLIRSFIASSLVLLFSLSTLYGQNSTPELDHKVISFSDSVAFADFQDAELDNYYPDLMRPENQNGDAEEIIKAWSSIHQKIFTFLNQEGFEWESDDPRIQIVNRIYFNPDGTVKHYFFRVLNNSVNQEKRMEFRSILEKYFDELKIDLIQSSIFAQCGKSSYPNS